jgi:hypothetical protein
MHMLPARASTFSIPPTSFSAQYLNWEHPHDPLRHRADTLLRPLAHDNSQYLRRSAIAASMELTHKEIPL